MIFKPVLRTVISPWRLKRLLAPSIEIMDLDHIYKYDIEYQNDKDVINDFNEETISFKNFKIKYRKKLTLYIIFAMLIDEKEHKSKLVTGIGISFKSINEKISNYYYNL